MTPLPLQIIWLFLLAIPIACIAWMVIHEEVFKEPREFCKKYCKECKSLLVRKFFYFDAFKLQLNHSL